MLSFRLKTFQSTAYIAVRHKTINNHGRKSRPIWLTYCINFVTTNDNTRTNDLHRCGSVIFTWNKSHCVIILFSNPAAPQAVTIQYRLINHKKRDTKKNSRLSQILIIHFLSIQSINCFLQFTEQLSFQPWILASIILYLKSTLMLI